MNGVIGKEIMKYVVKNATLIRVGQGNITISCQKLWDMDDEELIRLFLHERQK